MSETGSASGLAAARVFDRDKFLVHQKRLAVSEKYFIFDEHGKSMLFVHREAHHARSILALVAAIAVFGLVLAVGFWIQAGLSTGSRRGMTTQDEVVLTVSALTAMLAGAAVAIILQPKRHIGFFTDESRGTELLKVFQDSKWQIPIATYTVADGELNMLGWCRKNHLYNFFRRRWECFGPEGQLICVALEDSIVLSILRRVLGPMYGALRTNFIILGPDESTKLGEFNRKFTLSDKYVLDLTADESRRLDRRVALALGVLLDTGERR